MVEPYLESGQSGLLREYLMSGLLVQSRIHLPGATALNVSHTKNPADVTIEQVDQPLRIPNARSRYPWGEFADNDFLFRPLQGLAIRIRNGDEITFNQADKITDSQVRLFLVGTAWGVLCHQRSLVPLHASAVACDGGAMAFAAPAGTGKSTLAAALALRGYPLVADDVCVIKRDEESGVPMLYPFPAKGMKLAADAAAKLGLTPGERLPVVGGRDKSYVHVPSVENSNEPLPLRGFYAMSEAVGPTDSFSKLAGSELISHVMANVYRIEYIECIRSIAPLAEQVFQICRHVQGYSFQISHDLKHFDGMLSMLEAHLTNPKRNPVRRSAFE
ncbi:MAG: hypothetical protein AAGD43_10410 [Pseudomonadota bacterium]